MIHDHNFVKAAKAYGTGEADSIRKFLPMVRRLAWHVHGSGRDGIDLEDLMQAGLLALTECVRNHTGATDDGFAAYAKLRVRGAMIDLVRRHVYVGEKEIHLTPIEYKLLTTLAKHAGLVMTHRQLLKEVWGPLHVEESQYLRVYMRQLRHKLERDPARPKYLLTELGVGYRLHTL